MLSEVTQWLRPELLAPGPVFCPLLRASCHPVPTQGHATTPLPTSLETLGFSHLKTICLQERPLGEDE